MTRRSAASPSGEKEKQFGLGAGERLEVGSIYLTPKGTYKIKMGETYQGLPVIGEAVVLEEDDRGRQVGKLYGRLVEGLQEDLPNVTATLTKEEAFDIALTSSGDSPGEVQFRKDTDAQLAVYIQGPPEKIEPRLIYKLSYRVENRDRIARPTFYIDADNGSILRRWEGVAGAKRAPKKNPNLIAVPKYVLIDAEGGNENIGKKRYNGQDLPKLRVTKVSNDTCSLKNSEAIVYHCNQSYDCPLEDSKPFEFECDTGNPDYTNGGYSPLNDALYHIGVTCDMYRDWYGITDLAKTKGSMGGRIEVRAHYGQGLETAFWNGEYVTFGDGDRIHYPLTSINVVAHELSHGFTEKHSGLVYEGQSGAMNEAFSDMAGEVAEEYLKHSVDWLVASGTMKNRNTSMRYFADPTLDGRSVSQASDYCFTMDPHIASGIFNKAFYILSHTKDWTPRKAFQVFLVANDLYWHPESDFNSASCDVLQATSDLEYNKEDVNKAFGQVGVEPCKEKDQSTLNNPILLPAGGSITYQLTSNVQQSLRYSNLVVYTYGTVPIELTVTGESDIFKATKRKSVYDMIKFNAVAINTFHQCLHKACTVNIRTEQAGKVVLNPLAYVLTLASAESLRSRRSTLELTFQIPSYVLNSNLQVAFTAETVGEDMSYYIRHGAPPMVEVGNFDVVGHNHLPVVLCTPRRGVYYLKGVSDRGGVSNINIHMYALLKAGRIDEGSNPEGKGRGLFQG